MPLFTILTRILILVAFLLIIDLYAFSGIKTLFAGLSMDKYRKIAYAFYWGATILIFVMLLITLFTFNLPGNTKSPSASFKYLAILLVLLWLPKIVFCLFLLGEDVFRLVAGATVFIFDKLGWEPRGEEPFIEGRRKVISQIGLVVAAIPFASVIYGVTKGKYNYVVKEVTLLFKDLPKSFDGLTITHISDIHSGSFDDKKEVRRGVELVNKQKSDVVLFTGDLVNNRAEEFYPWIETFSKIEAPLGKYSSLGNHDYGEYVNWNSQKERNENFEALLENHGKMGFKLLRNENIIFTRDSDQIALVGVENWGLPPFPQKGNLEKAVGDMESSVFKILMSHDPSHWDAKVLPYRSKIHLTLSGHTHGMQFGIEIPGFIKWSPVKYKYPRWAGLYQVKDQYMYVNRGFGFIGFPGRIGIWPEITKITLKSV